MSIAARLAPDSPSQGDVDLYTIRATCALLHEQLDAITLRLRKSEDRRRAMLHIMGDMHETNKRLANHRKALLHILSDYEDDRRRLLRQTQRLDESRRAIL